MKITPRIVKDLFKAAKEASANAYVPYSGYRVGAALLCSDGSVYTGCNVENASYSLTICAERNAVFKAVSAGVRDFIAVAIYVDSERQFPPCGACRQVLSEFNPSLEVIYGNRNAMKQDNLSDLLPSAFNLDHD
jgi:cytidine deaminase